MAGEYSGMESRNLVILESKFSDCEHFKVWESSADVIEFLNLDADRDYEDIVRDFILDGTDPHKMQFTIVTKMDNRPVGRVVITHFNEKEDSLELNRIYIGDSENRRKGYGTEAVFAVLEYAFINLHLERVSVNHFVEDDRSAAFLKNIGFKSEGVSRSAFKKNGKYHDRQNLSMLRSEFFENRR